MNSLSKKKSPRQEKQKYQHRPAIIVTIHQALELPSPIFTISVSLFTFSLKASSPFLFPSLFPKLLYLFTSPFPFSKLLFSFASPFPPHSLGRTRRDDRSPLFIIINYGYQKSLMTVLFPSLIESQYELVF